MLQKITMFNWFKTVSHLTEIAIFNLDMLDIK